MSRENYIANTFTRGELSPLLDGRTDVKQYYSGAKTVENYFILPHGGLQRRPGTYYVAQTETMAETSRLIPFQFSTTQAYILEFGNLYIRFYRDKGQIDSGGSPYEIVSPYAEADLFDLQFVQDADTMYIVHPTYKPQKLTRTGHTSWTIGDYTPTADVFTSTDNYPACVAIYEQRLVFASTNNAPQKIFASKSGDYDDLTTGTGDDDGFVYTIGSKQVNRIRWLSDSEVLFIGTLGNIFKFWSGSNDEPVTPTNVSVKRISSYGSSKLQAQELGDFIYYLQRNDKIVREVGYSFEFDKFKPSEVSILSQHITGDAIVDMDYQQSPFSMLWCVRDDGQIAVLTRQIEQEVIGWSRIITDGEFESVAVIPGDGVDDEVWVIVRRYINGAYVRYVEYFNVVAYDEQEDGYFVDSGLTLDTPITVTGLTSAVPAVVTATGHGLSDGDTITLRKIVGVKDANLVDTLAAGVNNKKYKVANKTANDFELTDTDDNNFDTTSFGAYLSGGEVRKAVTAVSGLDHLEAESVAICADGAALANETVVSGALTADSAAGQIHAGMPFTSKLQTMRLEAGHESGTAQGKLKALSRVVGRFWESVGADVGDENVQDTINFRDVDDTSSDPIPLFTGDKEICHPGTFDETGYIVVKQTKPLPQTILALIAFFTTNEP